MFRTLEVAARGDFVVAAGGFAPGPVVVVQTILVWPGLLGGPIRLACSRLIAALARSPGRVLLLALVTFRLIGT